MKHTPAPWHVTNDGEFVDHGQAALVRAVNANEADMKLIAAAPFLLGLLRDLVDVTEVPDSNCSCHISPPCNDCVEYGHLRDLMANAKAAIAKATGAQS